ncbi:lysine N(6)-hydroxylase/L-ornithine N(5)-oxygenase family protein [Streptomyces sp. R44]|uniref:L-lysine N6-monooxygenase MbtG n=1 Tax=Streptomyces sp. R44 TaxID=3238633 RepID=A0AB39TDR3_9ACTN
MSDFDVIGIGVGPANLSLAALADPLPELRTRFLDAKPEFRWHPGLMLPDSQLTVTVFRDLVTLVDPKSRFSFLNFLVQEGRIFRFLEANGISCSRREFEQYYQWAAAQLPSVEWGRRVESVTASDDGFRVTWAGGAGYTARSLVLGSGSEPRLPAFARTHKGHQVIHSSDLARLTPEWKGRRVLVVGAGQSGAEVVNHLLRDEHGLPAELTWISSRAGFQPLDDSPFTNEWFSSNYVEYFSHLPATRREALLAEQRNAGGDGITDTLMATLYQRLYHLDHVLASPLRHRLLTSRRAVGMERDGSRLVVDLHDADRETVERLPVDLVIFCTGYDSRIPEYLKPLQDRLSLTDGRLDVRPDYSVAFDGPPHLSVYAQSFAERSHGLNDSLLSLAAWRSARIINSVTGREAYRVEHGATAVTWK